MPKYALIAYPLMEDALNYAASLLGPGQTMGTIDEAARQTIVAAGFPEFYYAVWHGVGLDIHGEPWIRSKSIERLEVGMITTLEPGVYLPGVGGIRIENLFHIVPDGFKRVGMLASSLDSMVLK